MNLYNKTILICIFLLVTLLSIGCFFGSKNLSSNPDEIGSTSDNYDTLAYSVDDTPIGSAPPPDGSSDTSYARDGYTSTGSVDYYEGSPIEEELGYGDDTKDPKIVETPYVADQKEVFTNYPIGKISYSIPDTMEYYKREKVVLRITKNEIDSIILARANTTINHNFVLVENIRVSNIMSAELIDLSTEKSFNIKELSSKEQNIEEFGYTEWQWMVTPLKSGQIPLKLIIKIMIQSDGKSTLKDIPVFEKDIYVYAKPIKSAGNFLKEYWQWFFAVILIPVFKYFFNKREKENEEEENKE